MIFARLADGHLSNASPGLSGSCPQCGNEMIPKCGDIKIWHWAHKSTIDCDNWTEPESEWHLNWKRLVDPEYTEVVIRKPDGIHRADIKVNDLVIEFQHSALTPAKVTERERFYGNMIWVLDGKLFNDLRLERQILNDEYCFKYYVAPKSWIREITNPRFYHFDRITFDTYYDGYFYEQNQVFSNPLRRLPDDIPLKRFMRYGLGTITLEDILIHPTFGECCEIIPKGDFMKKFLPPKKPKVLFSW